MAYQPTDMSIEMSRTCVVRRVFWFCIPGAKGTHAIGKHADILKTVEISEDRLRRFDQLSVKNQMKLLRHGHVLFNIRSDYWATYANGFVGQARAS